MPIGPPPRPITDDALAAIAADLDLFRIEVERDFMRRSHDYVGMCSGCRRPFAVVVQDSVLDDSATPAAVLRGFLAEAKARECACPRAA